MQCRIINGFELKSPLGEGGMAEVWYAENSIGKKSAVKILDAGLANKEQIVERFYPNRSLENIESCGHPCKRLLFKYL